MFCIKINYTIIPGVPAFSSKDIMTRIPLARIGLPPAMRMHWRYDIRCVYSGVALGICAAVLIKIVSKAHGLLNKNGDWVGANV